MPVPTNVSPKSNPNIGGVPASSMETETASGTVSTNEVNLSMPAPTKEGRILVIVNHGEMFTIQAENSVQCITGPAQVPMISPNGAIPPIQVPQGYTSQVMPGQRGWRIVTVIPENHSIHYRGAARLPPPVQYMPSVPHIPISPGACYNYGQQSGIPGSQPTSVYPPSNHSNFITQPISVYPGPDGLPAHVPGQFPTMPMESDEAQSDKWKDQTVQMPSEAPQLPSAGPARSSPHWISSSGASSSTSVSSLSSASSPDSPQKNSDTYPRTPPRERSMIPEGYIGLSPSTELWRLTHHAGGDCTRQGVGFDSTGTGSQPVARNNSNELQQFVKHSDSSYIPVSSYQRPYMAEDEFDLKTFLSAIIKPEVVAVTSTSASIRWMMQYSPPVDAKWVVSFKIHVMSKTKDGGKFKAIIRESDDETELLKDLKPGVEYQTKVLAEADAIEGAFSEVTTFKTPSCAPNTPAAPKVTKQTKNSLVLKWSAPNDNGEKIFKYLLEWDEGNRGSGFRSLYSNSQKQYKVDKLQPSHNYTFRLCCQNAMGVSPWSTEVSYQTASAPPVAPSSPALVHSSVQSLTVQWGFPENTQSGKVDYSCETKFTLQMDDGNDYGFIPAYNGSDRKFTVTGLTKSSSYKFRVRAYNDDGNSGFSPTSCFCTLPDKPSPPGKVTLRGKAHSTFFKVYWDEPFDDGGSAIEEYTLESCHGKGQKMLSLYRGNATEFTVNNAVPGSTYRLRVFCVSKGGTSMPSEVAFVSVPSVVPGQCCPPWSDVKPGSNFIHLQWGAPEYDGGSEVTHYEVGMWQEGDDIKSVFLGGKLNGSVYNLKPGVTYKFAVRAGNKTGMGRWSEFAELQAGSAPPECPRDLKVDHVSAKAVHLSWTEPHNNGSEISGYTVEYGGQESTMNCRESVSSLTCSIHHLTPNHLYFFRVQCENEAGRSTFSDVVGVKTAPSCPGSITRIGQIDVPSEGDQDVDDPDVYLYPSSPTTVLIQWEKPLDFGSEITGYQIEVSDAKSSKDRYSDADFAVMEVGPVLRLQIDDLAADKEYRVRVRAINAVGLGQFSPVFSIRTRPLPPDPPALECLSSSTSLKLRWSGTDAEDTCKLQMLDKYGRFVNVYDGLSKSYKVMKLEEKTEYLFRISARNESGEGPFSNIYSFFTTATQPPQLKNPPTVEILEDKAIITWEGIESIKGDEVSYVVSIRSSDSHDIQQVITDDAGYLLQDLLPDVDYAVQVAILRHARTKSRYLRLEEEQTDMSQQDITESNNDNSETSEEATPIDHIEDVYEDITGPYTAWVGFKIEDEEVPTPLSHSNVTDEAPSKISGFLGQLKMLLNDDRVQPMLLMIIFFVLAFISAYLVQFVVD